jgi:ATP-binding cassette subfamily F protein 3
MTVFQANDRIGLIGDKEEIEAAYKANLMRYRVAEVLPIVFPFDNAAGALKTEATARKLAQEVWQKLHDGAPFVQTMEKYSDPNASAAYKKQHPTILPSSKIPEPVKRAVFATLPGQITDPLSFGNAVQIGYLAQLRGAAIPGATVLDALLDAIPLTPGEARAYLARFLFRGDDAFKEVRSLSGGERSRLELALLGIMPSNLLLLDEPTNHLDIPAREAIESFMLDSPATLLVVSHDRRLLETICSRLWVVGDGAAAAFDGGYREWRAAVSNGWTVAEAAARPPAARGSVTASRPVGNGAPGGRAVERGADAPRAKPSKSAKPVRRERLSKDAYRRQRETLDAELSRLGLRKSHLELAMSDPAVAANFVEMRRVTSELVDVDAALASAEDAWLELEERAP